MLRFPPPTHPPPADNKHVVFGRVLGDGMLAVRKLEAVATGPNNRPKLPCVITQVGREVGARNA